MVNEGSPDFFVDEDDDWTVYTIDDGLSAQVGDMVHEQLCADRDYRGWRERHLDKPRRHSHLSKLTAVINYHHDPVVPLKHIPVSRVQALRLPGRCLRW